ncbi:MAG: molybdopterin-synthase adenylyltransferase MoeB [Sphingomonadales bacterium]|nr:molybdopterin-synthase adenylyltransferase MoeB [Sphingomonadales bacterium]
MKLSDQQLDRYARHIILKEVGGMGQKKLLAAKVLVVGAGGLGSPLLLYLAAAGVGTIGIVDDDIVSLSNLQRQVVHDTSAVGTPKTDSAEARVNAINPDVTVVKHNEKLTTDNAEKLIAQYDIVADGCDNFETRLLVNDTCAKLGKTLVSAALSQFEGQLATFKPFAASDTPLPCYRCFVPDVPSDQTEQSCSERGILGVIAGVMGTMQATEVLKEILDIGDGLAGKILLYDALSQRQRVIALPRDPNCPTCKDL